MTQKLKKLIGISFIASNIIVVFFYLLACLVPFLNAGKHWFIALLGLIFPLLFFVVLGLCVYWLIRRSKWGFVYVAALLLSWQQIIVLFGYSTDKKFNVAKKSDTIRVLSWNLSSWGISNKLNVQKIGYKKQMLELIKNADADVLCFQEFLFSREANFNDSVFPELKEKGYQYGYFVKNKIIGRVYKSALVTGVAILSKLPITDTAQFEYSKDALAESLIYTDIQISNQKIRLFTTHLQSVRFEEYDYEALHKLKEANKPSATQSRAIIWKLRQAYKIRAKQAVLVNQKIKESPYPVIVCGDFNDVPNSYTYFTIKGDLQDAFLKKGNGLGRTFRFISPTLRIDYILADKKFDVLQYSEFKVPYSDHYPVVADFNIAEKK